MDPRLLVCSNRGPLRYVRRDERLIAQPSSGGLVSALRPIARAGTATWLACPSSDLERSLADAPSPLPPWFGFVTVPADLQRRFYDEACVLGLGFLFHELFDRSSSPLFDQSFHRAWAAYRSVNDLFAIAVAGRPDYDAVLIEDYHLMLLARQLRRNRRRTSAPLLYFHHVPWCSPNSFGMLPGAVRQEILSGLIEFDAIGFHSTAWAAAFLACCDAFLSGASVSEEEVRWQGRRALITVAPAQTDAGDIQEALGSMRAAKWQRRFEALAGSRPLVVRVDRVDLWKNIVRGFLAFERAALAEADSDIQLLALLCPSRLHLAPYRRYLRACVHQARRTNHTLRERGLRAEIHVKVGNDRTRALAAMAVADVVFVNPTSDGLNLVAKEAVAAAPSRISMVLSKNAGVYEEIGHWVRGVNPFDIVETGDVLAVASRGDDLRAGQRSDLARHVQGNSPTDWLRRRLNACAVVGQESHQQRSAKGGGQAGGR